MKVQGMQLYSKSNLELNSKKSKL